MAHKSRTPYTRKLCHEVYQQGRVGTHLSLQSDIMEFHNGRQYHWDCDVVVCQHASLCVFIQCTLFPHKTCAQTAACPNGLYLHNLDKCPLACHNCLTTQLYMPVWLLCAFSGSFRRPTEGNHRSGGWTRRGFSYCYLLHRSNCSAKEVRQFLQMKI